MNIENEIYEIIKSKFEYLDHDQALVVMALALEKMWVPYLEGIRKSECTEEEKIEILKMAEQCMYRVWRRIKRGKPSEEDLEYWNKMCDRLNEMFDGEEIEFGEDALWFDGELIGSAWTFFIKNQFDIEYCVNTVSRVLDMIIGRLDAILDEYNPKLKMQNSEQYDSIIRNHPALLNELKRINIEIQLARQYPNNLDEILKKGSEYHKLNLLDVQVNEI